LRGAIGRLRACLRGSFFTNNLYRPATAGIDLSFKLRFQTGTRFVRASQNKVLFFITGKIKHRSSQRVPQGLLYNGWQVWISTLSVHLSIRFAEDTFPNKRKPAFTSDATKTISSVSKKVTLKIFRACTTL